MSYEVTGTLITRSEVETKGESFRVRTFGIKLNDGGQYENYASFQLTQDRVSLVENLKQGDEVKVHFDLRGRQWQDKILTNLNAWKIEVLNSSVGAGSAPAPKQEPEPVAAESSDDELLPF